MSGPSVEAWRMGLHALHCREDRCGPNGERCECPCHTGERMPELGVPTGPTGEPIDQAATVPCPTCGAGPGDRCTDLAGRPAPGVLCHRARAQVWRASRGPALDRAAVEAFLATDEIMPQRITEVDEHALGTIGRLADAVSGLSDRVGMLELDRKGDQE